jgi:hypothetical protein
MLAGTVFSRIPILTNIFLFNFSRFGYDPNARPQTPEDLKLSPSPKRVMHAIYPLVLRKILEVKNIFMGFICLYFAILY